MLQTSFRSFFGQASEQIILREQAENVITHLTHLEELILTKKEEGLKLALFFLKELYNTLHSNASSKTFVGVKYDGAPAIITGYHPENGKFFVATKSITNVNPKINYTEEDVQANHSKAPGLAKKLKLALTYLPSVIRENIYQGDFMFDAQDLDIKNIDGENFVTFKPNTITYAVISDSALGQKIRRSKIGIVFHTRYTGSNLQNLQKSSDVNVGEFNQTRDVFFDDAKFKDMSGVATFTNEESIEFDDLIDKCEIAGRRVKWNKIDEKLYEDLNTFINNLIRQKQFIETPEQSYEDFLKWLDHKYESRLREVTKDKAILRRYEEQEAYLKNINASKMSILNIFNLSVKLSQAKMLFIDKYNKAIKTKQFLTQPDGSLRVTNPEGYVAVDNSGNMVKFVSRLDFSAANFALSKGEKFK